MDASIRPCCVCYSYPCICDEVTAACSKEEDDKKSNYLIQGFVVEFKVYFTNTDGVDSLKEEVEEFIIDLDDTQFVDDFVITPVYEGEYDDEPS